MSAKPKNLDKAKYWPLFLDFVSRAGIDGDAFMEVLTTHWQPFMEAYPNPPRKKPTKKATSKAAAAASLGGSAAAAPAPSSKKGSAAATAKGPSAATATSAGGVATATSAAGAAAADGTPPRAIRARRRAARVALSTIKTKLALEDESLQGPLQILDEFLAD